MGFFSRKPKVNTLGATSVFHIEYIRGRLPTPGAMEYAYAAFALPQQSPIGAGIRLRDPIRPLAGNSYYPAPFVPTNGIPTVSGQIFGQPLFDPNLPGYSAGMPPDISPLVAFNIPASVPHSIGNNTPFPTKTGAI